MVTNHHVVEGCKTLLVRGFGQAIVQVVDVYTDLAVLRVSGAAAHPYAKFDKRGLAKLGEEVVWPTSHPCAD